MTRPLLWGTLFICVFAILESTLFVRLSILPIVPDFALAILVYISYLNGVATGQALGFTSGLVLDFISASPLGFNALLRTVIGAIVGLLHGTFFLDSVLLPMILVAVATIVKALFTNILSFLFSGALPAYDFFSASLWVEFAINTLIAPPLFALLKMFDVALKPKRSS